MDPDGFRLLLAPDGWALLGALPPYRDGGRPRARDGAASAGPRPAARGRGPDAEPPAFTGSGQVRRVRRRHALHARRARAGHPAGRGRTPRPALPGRRRDEGRGPGLRRRRRRDRPGGARPRGPRRRAGRGDGGLRHREPASPRRGRASGTPTPSPSTSSPRASTPCSRTRRVGTPPGDGCSTPPPIRRPWPTCSPSGHRARARTEDRARHPPLGPPAGRPRAVGQRRRRRARGRAVVRPRSHPRARGARRSSSRREAARSSVDRDAPTSPGAGASTAPSAPSSTSPTAR